MKLSYPPKMMPHEIIQDALRHPFRSEIARVQFLVAPFYPAGCRADAIDETQGGHLIRVAESVAG